LRELPRIAPAAMIVALVAAMSASQATAKDIAADQSIDIATTARLKIITSLSPMVTPANRAAARVLFRDAYSRLHADDLTEAVRLFERGLVLNPGAPLANLWLAESYRRQGLASYASDQRALAEALAAMTDNAKVADMQTEMPDVNPWAQTGVDPKAPGGMTSGRFLRLWRNKVRSLK